VKETRKAVQRRQVSQNLNANPVVQPPSRKKCCVNLKRSEAVKAMILAAGLGTRLMPITREIPKALVEVNDIPLLEMSIRKLRSEGFNEIIINIHHHGKAISEYLDKNKFPGTYITISDETDTLLDTGGGIWKARWFLDGMEPFLVFNVDVITSMNLGRMRDEHLRNECLATLAVSKRKSSRYLLFDQENNLCGWKDLKGNREKWSRPTASEVIEFGFSGIHMINPVIFQLITEKGRFSIIDAYLRLAAGHRVCAFDHTGEIWFDLGKPDQIGVVSDFLRKHPEIIPS